MSTAPTSRFAQLTYTAFHRADGTGGGWQVKDTRGDITPEEQALAIERISTRLDVGSATKRFLNSDEIAALPRRLVYGHLGEGDAQGRLKDGGTVAWWHTAPAGFNSSGRPNNVFAHVLLDRTPAAAFPPLRPSDMLATTQWLRPYGDEDVLATTLDCVAEPPWRAEVSRSRAAAFVEEAAVTRPGTLAHLLDAVVAAMQGNPMVVLGVSQASRAERWIAAVCHLMSAGTSRRLFWSTAERADTVGAARDAGLHLVVVPVDDLDAIEPADEYVMVSDVFEAGSLGDLELAADHHTRHGSQIPVTPWSVIVAAVGSVGVAEQTMVLLDQVAHDVGDRQLECAWPLAMATARMPVELGDVAAEAALAVVTRPPGLQPGTPLDNLRRRLLSRELGNTARDALAVVREQAHLPAEIRAFAANVYLERALTDRVLLTAAQPAPVPVPELPASLLDHVVIERAHQVLAALTAPAPEGPRTDSPAAPPPTGPRASAMEAVRLLDFAVRARLVDPRGPSQAEKSIRRLMDRIVAPELLHPSGGPRLIGQIEPIAEATRAVVIRPWFDRHLDTAPGRPGCRLTPQLLSWLAPSLPPWGMSDRPPGLMVEAAAQATLVLGDPSSLRVFALWAALASPGFGDSDFRRLVTETPPLPIADVCYLLQFYPVAKLAPVLAPALLAAPYGPDLQVVIERVLQQEAESRSDDPAVFYVGIAAQLRWAQGRWWRSFAHGEVDPLPRLLDAAEWLLDSGGNLPLGTELAHAVEAANVVELVVADTPPQPRPRVHRHVETALSAVETSGTTAVAISDCLDRAVLSNVVTDVDLVLAAQVTAVPDLGWSERPWLADLAELRVKRSGSEHELLDWIVRFRMLDGRFRPSADFVEAVRDRLKRYGLGAHSTKVDHDRPVREWWRRIGVTDEEILAPVTPRRRWT